MVAANPSGRRASLQLRCCRGMGGFEFGTAWSSVLAWLAVGGDDVLATGDRFTERADLVQGVGEVG
jgi:hypothetical protein